MHRCVYGVHFVEKCGCKLPVRSTKGYGDSGLYCPCRQTVAVGFHGVELFLDDTECGACVAVCVEGFDEFLGGAGDEVLGFGRSFEAVGKRCCLAYFARSGIAVGGACSIESGL